MKSTVTSLGKCYTAHNFFIKTNVWKSRWTSDTVSVFVGPKAKRYAVHEPLPTQYGWLRKIIHGSGDLASQGSIALHAEDLKVIEGQRFDSVILGLLALSNDKIIMSPHLVPCWRSLQLLFMGFQVLLSSEVPSFLSSRKLR